MVISISCIKGSWGGGSTAKEIFQAKSRVETENFETENWGSKFLTPVAGGNIESDTPLHMLHATLGKGSSNMHANSYCMQC